MQPLMERMFFVSHQTSEELLEDIGKAGHDWRSAVTNRPIPTVPLGVGVTPLELGLVA